MKTCDVYWRGWKCKRSYRHGGPCALVPKWWNLKSMWRYHR